MVMWLRLGDGGRASRSPRHALTFDEIRKLESDNFDSGDYWIMVDEEAVTLCGQKRHFDAITMMTIPRSDFMKLIDWFNRDQSTTD